MGKYKLLHPVQIGAKNLRFVLLDVSRKFVESFLDPLVKNENFSMILVSINSSKIDKLIELKFYQRFLGVFS